MGRKKQQKNAFSFFLDDYVDAQREKGRRISHRIGAEECAPLWRELCEKEKQRYGEMAGAYRESSKRDKSHKLTSFRVSSAQIERKQKLYRNKMESADNEIRSTISNLDDDLLPNHLFYIVHCNYYCKTNEEVFIPGEIAICEFNLRDGIKRSYHTLVNPGEIPLGFAYEAQRTIDEVHKLPYPPYSEGCSDYFGILQEILKFLEPGKLSDGRYPPLYCLENNIKATENILEMVSKNGRHESAQFRIYLLHKMFFHLKNKCVENAREEGNLVLGFPVLSNAILEIEKDIFCYAPGISCNFHCNIEEKYQNCSLSIVQRFVYVVCDHCCQSLNIEIVPGKHSRLKCDTNRRETVVRIEKELENQRKMPKEKTGSHVDGISSFYGGRNVPEWTKITSFNFLENELLRELDAKPLAKPPFASVSAGRGRKNFFGKENNFEASFPVLSRGRGANKAFN